MMAWGWRWQASEVADKLGLTDVLTTRVSLAHAVAPACSGNVFIFSVPLLVPALRVFCLRRALGLCRGGVVRAHKHRGARALLLGYVCLLGR